MSVKTNYNRIMMAGPSGIGKTTIARWLSEYLGKPFISGSVSDLLPDTKDLKHVDMLSRDSKDLYQEDYQILNIRNKKFKALDSFISDRSYLDSLTYFLYKQADKIPSCEMEQFKMLCSTLLVQQCDLLIVLEFLPENISQWVTEDNGKRITSNYFQAEISGIMNVALGMMEYDNKLNLSRVRRSGNVFSKLLYKDIDCTFSIGNISNVYGSTDVLIIPSLSLEERKEIIINKL